MEGIDQAIEEIAETSAVNRLQMRIAELEQLEAELPGIRERLDTIEKMNALIAGAKDSAYRERNQLVAALSKLFPASLERHPEEDREWENDWRWIVFVDLPTGQATWHIHDSELGMFDHLPRLQGRKWDGHTTEEKYSRLGALVPWDEVDNEDIRLAMNREERP